ncbi:hypothetical protein BOC35_15345 [Burkholderia pseudomallei]|nr:hypothetical protein BOC35_15345 [Burkholderia pseudomallei]ARK60223.1 hypothetical protein BOC37_09895 [Burkholderia pseudomallei]ARL05542.1 hypothetical protein BOC44_28650 [Burkholderia pseudomallei]ARL13281.1 hypothetical protein BOC45_32905 [Burkholderia pseudomallei]ARL90100.1 hypothetical protein BOC57_29500 [Burkholderia pseudomallei]
MRMWRGAGRTAASRIIARMRAGAPGERLGRAAHAIRAHRASRIATRDTRHATRRRARPRRASCRLSAGVRGRRAAHSPRDTETSSERHTHGKRVLNTRRFDFVRR